ncbi:MAG: MM0924 family protein [Pyrinomonadaceae bacterium]
MNELLTKMTGRRIYISCGTTANLRGEVLSLEGGILRLKDDDDQLCYVALDKIVAIWEAPDESSHRAGFVSKLPKK